MEEGRKRVLGIMTGRVADSSLALAWVGSSRLAPIALKIQNREIFYPAPLYA
jgi:hypothetical protein